MKILLYFENADIISKSGIGRAMKHQIAALESQSIDYTLDPDDDFDIAHINTIGLKSDILIKKWRKEGKKIIYHAHSTEEDFRNSFIFSNQIAPLFKIRLISLYSKADCIITPTPYSKKLISQYKGITQKIYAISNGIDIDSYDYNETYIQQFRNYFHLQPNQKVVMSVGLFFRRKGILDFIEIAKRLPNYTFIWFGDTPLYTIPHDIRKIVTGEHPDNVIFPGYIAGDIIKGAYAGSHAFLFASYEETEGIVVLEALASYQQVILRDIPVYNDWLEDGIHCYKGKNVDELTQLVYQVVEKKVPHLGKNGRKIAEEKSITEVGKQLHDIYQSLLK